MKKYNGILISLIMLSAPAALAAGVPVPVATDSRIKTFVYSENDVFNIVAHYGYQSNIEFPVNEPVETISVGNRMGWQITTSGRRMFIRPTLANARTNMTVVTSKRAYQFDLTAVPAVYSPNEELAYVVRFFYPDDKKNMMAQAAYADEMAAPAAVQEEAVRAGHNYSYSYTGDADVAPLKVFDDGNATYFKLKSSIEYPRIAVMNKENQEVPVTIRRDGDYWVVDTVASQFVIRNAGVSACVFNDKYTQR